MIYNVDAIFDEGVFRPVEPVQLPDGPRVHLRVERQNGAGEAEETQTEGKLPTLLERMHDVVGAINDLPEDSSINLDHYLYGTPKR